MQPSLTVKKSPLQIDKSRSRDFGLSVNNRHNHALIWLPFLVNPKFGNSHGRIFNKFKPMNIRIKMIFFELLLQQKLLLDYTLKWFSGLFDARPEIFPSLKQVWRLGFLCGTLWRFCMVFLCDVLICNSTLSQIYWISDLQSLKLVCFIATDNLKQ